MSIRILCDRTVVPTPETLEAALGKRRCAVLLELIDTVTGVGGLEFQWRFYNDSKSWLGKATYKKKTIFWLSVYDDGLRVNFYFTEKNRDGVLDLNLDGEIKTAFALAEMSGKMVQLPLLITKKAQLKDVLELVRYKETLK